MDTSLTAALALGFILGLRHALDADHIAAVTTLVSQHRSLGHSVLLGTFWGAGHTAALLAAAVIVFAFKVAISPAIEHWMEMAVSVLLIALGANVLRRCAAEWRLHRHAHEHDGVAHVHVHLHPAAAGAAPDAHGHAHLMRLGRRPFLIGLLHGMAGSAALTLVVLASIPSPASGLLYVLVFGIGSTVGMLVLSGMIGVPFILTAGRSRGMLLGLQVLAGTASLALGCWILWELSLA